MTARCLTTGASLALHSTCTHGSYHITQAHTPPAQSIGAGPDLASALLKLAEYGKSNKVERVNGAGLGIANGAFAQSYIDNPPSRESPFLNLFGLLSSHPSHEERIQRLLEPGENTD